MTSAWSLYRGELTKLLKQRGIAILLIWIWPLFGLVVPLFIMVFSLINSASTGSAPVTFKWTDIALGVWNIPTNLLGRLLFITLASMLFSGEYQWGTWKNIVPRADRVSLMLAKYAAFTTLLIVGIVLMSILLTFGVGIIQTARGIAYPPSLTAEALQLFAYDYLIYLCLTVVNTLIGTSLGALLATVTRSLLGAVIGGIVFVGGEIGFVAVVTTLGIFLKSPSVAGLSRFTSSINIANIQSLVQSGTPMFSFMENAPTNTISASFVILVLWATVFVGLHLWMFQRQDLR